MKKFSWLFYAFGFVLISVSVFMLVNTLSKKSSFEQWKKNVYNTHTEWIDIDSGPYAGLGLKTSIIHSNRPIGPGSDRDKYYSGFKKKRTVSIGYSILVFFLGLFSIWHGRKYKQYLDKLTEK